MGNIRGDGQRLQAGTAAGCGLLFMGNKGGSAVLVKGRGGLG